MALLAAGGGLVQPTAATGIPNDLPVTSHGAFKPSALSGLAIEKRCR
jgi:hypothetical protein